MVSISFEVVGIGLNPSGVEFLWEWLGLVRIPLGAGGYGQNSLASGWDCFESFGSMKVWLKFHWVWPRLVRIPLGAGSIYPISPSSREEM